MKHRLVCGALLALTCGGVQAEEASQAQTLDSLESITRQTDEAPALLYLTPSQVASAAEEMAKPAPRRAKPSRAGSQADSGSLRELKAQQAVINQLLAKANQQTAELAQLRQQLSQTEQSSEQLTALQATLKQVQQDGESLKQQLAKQTADLTAAQQEKTALQQTLTANQDERTALQQTLTANQTERTALQTQLAALKTELEKAQQEKKPTVTVPQTGDGARDYAIGTELGAEILALLDERSRDGITVDKTLALAGVEDSFSGKYRLTADKVTQALKALTTAQQTQEQALKTQTELKGSKYLESFKKQPRAKKAALGYYYRVDYQGKGAIADNDTVAIVVKESLTDGTVIKDMELADTSISQPLNAYPPLFKTALSQIQNHGSVTLVVPPALAYGDKGLPPSIPPGSTMVYTVRVLDVIPAVK